MIVADLSSGQVCDDDVVTWRDTFTKAMTVGLRAAVRAGAGKSAAKALSGHDDRRSPRREGGQTEHLYPGDFAGRATIEYSPRADGNADPGEIVWGWVPFEEDYSQGKDRPTLVIGHDDGWLLALMLTSKDHDRDAANQAAQGRVWFDIGTGDWDAQRRPSEVRIDRVLRLDPAAVRREGGRLERETFDAVARELHRVHGW